GFEQRGVAGLAAPLRGHLHGARLRRVGVVAADEARVDDQARRGRLRGGAGARQREHALELRIARCQRGGDGEGGLGGGVGVIAPQRKAQAVGELGALGGRDAAGRGQRAAIDVGGGVEVLGGERGLGGARELHEVGRAVGAWGGAARDGVAQRRNFVGERGGQRRQRRGAIVVVGGERAMRRGQRVRRRGQRRELAGRAERRRGIADGTGERGYERQNGQGGSSYQTTRETPARGEALNY